MNIRQRLTLSVSCLLLMLGSVALAHADVTVTSADPAEAPQGTVSLDVTVTGNGFDSSAQVAFLVTGTTNPGGITVRKVSVRGSKKLIATIDIADTAVVDKFDIQVALSDGRKGKGTTLFTVQLKPNADPCTRPGLDFPAFIYWQPTNRGQQIYVADSTGQCSRPVYKTAPKASTVLAFSAFSYPVAGTSNVGRIAWQEDGAIYRLDFVVTGSAITVQPKIKVYDGFIRPMDLSADGTLLYIALDVISPDDPQRVLRLTIDSGLTAEVYRGDPGSWFSNIAVNGDGLVLYADQALAYPNDGHRVLRIASSCGDESCAEILAANPTGTSAPLHPAPSFVTPMLVYSDYLPGSNNCWLLQVIPESGGSIVNSGQPRYGTRSSWYGDQILTNGRNPPDGSGRCADTGFVTQIDPATGAETQLVRGYDPDGR